jgi:hypothetical protein
MNEKLANLYKLQGFLESATLIIQGEGLLGGHRSNADEYITDVQNMVYEAIQEEKSVGNDINITSDSGISYPTTHYTEGLSVSSSSLMLGGEEDEIAIRVNKEEYDKLKNEVGVNPPTIPVQVGEIKQGTIDDYSITTDKFKSLLEKVKSYESNIKVTSDEIPVKYDGTEF